MNEPCSSSRVCANRECVHYLTEARLQALGPNPKRTATINRRGKDSCPGFVSRVVVGSYWRERGASVQKRVIRVTSLNGAHVPSFVQAATVVSADGFEVPFDKLRLVTLNVLHLERRFDPLDEPSEELR